MTEWSHRKNPSGGKDDRLIFRDGVRVGRVYPHGTDGTRWYWSIESTDVPNNGMCDSLGDALGAVKDRMEGRPTWKQAIDR